MRLIWEYAGERIRGTHFGVIVLKLARKHMRGAFMKISFQFDNPLPNPVGELCKRAKLLCLITEKAIFKFLWIILFPP